MSKLSSRKDPISFRPAFRYYIITWIVGILYAGFVYLTVSYDMIQTLLERSLTNSDLYLIKDIPLDVLSEYIDNIFIALIFVPVARIAYNRWDAKFIITANEVVIRRNILTKSINITNWEAVDGLRVHQSLAGRIFNYGIIEFIYESAQGIDEMNLLYGVIAPQKLKNELTEHLNEVKYL